MIKVDLKSLLKRLNRFTTRSLEGAAGLCVSRNHYEVTVGHLLLKLIEEPAGDIQPILKHFGIDISKIQKVLLSSLENLKSGNAGKPVFSPGLIEWFQESWTLGSIDLGLTEIRSGLLFAGLVANPARYLDDEFSELLEPVRLDDFKKNFFEITKASVEAAPAQKEGVSGKEGAGSRGDESALGRFTINFTASAREDKLDPVFGRDREIRQMIDILARRRKNNPIVVGEAGVGKTAVVEGLALRVVQGDVPDILKNVEILSLDMGLLQAGAGMKGEFENRLKSVISEVKTSPKPIILFIDEAHTLIGAGGSAGMSDAANLLKPALARGELRTVAATTWSEYKKYFEKDAALARRFQLVNLPEPSEEDAVIILRGLREKYELSHQVHIQDDAVVAAAKMSSRYISGRQLPDKAVDLLDTAAARVKIGLTGRPDQLEDIERKIQVLERELGAYRRDQEGGKQPDKERIQRMAEIQKEIAQNKEAFEKLEKRWKGIKELSDRYIALRKEMRAVKEEKAKELLFNELKIVEAKLEMAQGKEPVMKLQVDPEVIAKVVSDWTGIPVGKMVKDDLQEILKLNSKMIGRIKGQDHAIEAIARGIRASKSGLGNPEAPIGVFLFVGPSGVGKTETALSVADLLFGGERFMVTINMSEFQEKHTVSRLIGSPPGYVGYGEGGVLTEAVRQRPYSVVLLDEVEKADPEVLNLFYQVFDKGMLSDGEGRIIDFKNTVIFMTSNLASDEIIQLSSGGSKPTPEALVAGIRPILSRHFKPALLARMTIVPYYPISSDVMGEIIELKLKRIGKRLFDSHRMKMEYDPIVVQEISARCTEVETGARNIDHIIQGNLLPQISTEILTKLGEGTLPERLKIGIKEDAGFSFEFSNGETVLIEEISWVDDIHPDVSKKIPVPAPFAGKAKGEA
jgi:type VI secretion system protein VasG